MNWNDLWLRVRALAFRNRAERELDEELQFHLEMEARKNTAAGAGEPEAARLARVRFGGLLQVKEECRSVRGTRLVETLFQDVRYALRSFRRNPAFVLTVVGTIALGLGLNAALFTLFNAYVLRPLSIHDPYSLYSFSWTDRSERVHSFSWRDFEGFRTNGPALSDVFAARFLYARVDGHPLMGELVTGNYFQVLGVNAALGRTLLPEDSAAPGRAAVIVLSYSAWQSKFGGNPGMVGKTLRLHDCPLEVIGVAEQGFHGLGDTPREYWVPLTMAAHLESTPDLFGPEHPDGLEMVGRLKPGMSTSQAEAALTGWSKQLTADRPDSEKAVGAVLRSRATAVPFTFEMLELCIPLAVAFGLILLLACANVANLMLARAMARQREIGIRLSLGAARFRLIRQLLTESALLAIPSAAAGFIVSQATIRSSLWLMFATLPPDMAEFITLVPLPPDARVFLFMVLAALASAALFGLAPAIQGTRADLVLAARGEFTCDVRLVRLRNALVIGQITVCVILLISSGVLLRGVDRMKNFDLGFKTRGVIVMEIEEKLRSKVLAQLSSGPMAREVAAAASTPLNGMPSTVTISAGQGQTALTAWYNYASPEYFALLEIPILRGRSFTAGEASSQAPVVVISQATAQRLWPNSEQLGQAIYIKRDSRTGAGERLPRDQAVRVIGVARDIVTCSIPYGKDPTLVYFPTTPAAARNSLLVRLNGDVETARRNLDLELRKMVPGSVQQIHPLDQYLAGGIYPFRVASWIGSALGGLALLLALSGIYGVLSYLITQRTKEIGIRVALGATTAAVTGLVLKQSLRMAVIGVGLGTALSLLVSRLVSSSVFFVMFLNTFDAVAYAGAVFLVCAASLAGACFPSRRAARIDPVTTLRFD